MRPGGIRTRTRNTAVRVSDSGYKRGGRRMRKIRVTIGSPDQSVAGQWDALIRRAPGNVFMNPAALHAATATAFARIHVLLAWQATDGPDELVGVWALEERKIAPCWPAFLAAPPFNYAFLSNPVVDPAVAGDVMQAFFAALVRSPALPKVVRLRYLDADAETYASMRRALDIHGGQSLNLAERARPFASKTSGVKRSGSTRKKLRQDWNRLSALGSVDIVNDRTPSGVREAFETYLAMEAGSWKGAKGTALLCAKDDATFARRLIGDLADRQDASVALLRVGGHPIAAQVLLYCAPTAYTWKTAFDSNYAKYSPGALLVDKISEELFASGGIAAIESCSPEGGFMAQMWDGRRATIDLLIDVGAKQSLNFKMAAVSERSYAMLRNLRNRLRGASWSPLPKRKGLAASR
jgi:CelD/BcsL family acetyltransferase involved in cellulose biosynthesis